MKADELYKKITRRKYVLLVSLAVATIISLIIDISTGPAQLSISEVFFTIISPDHSDPTTRVIVWVIRLPMALMAISVGASLAIAGAQMQTILDNPLASPYTLGISAAAGFGAALALVLGIGVIPHAETILIPLNAFIFSMLACLLIFFISKIKGVSTETMVLSGIALLFMFNSLLASLQYFASEDELQAVVFWLFGSLLKTTWPKLGIATAVLLIVTPLLLNDAWKLTALKLGDEKATAIPDLPPSNFILMPFIEI